MVITLRSVRNSVTDSTTIWVNRITPSLGGHHLAAHLGTFNQADQHLGTANDPDGNGAIMASRPEVAGAHQVAATRTG